MGGKAGRKRRHFLRPQAPEEAGAQLSELHKEWWTVIVGTQEGVGLAGEAKPSPHQYEPEGAQGPLPACPATLGHHQTGPQALP